MAFDGWNELAWSDLAFLCKEYALVCVVDEMVHEVRDDHRAVEREREDQREWGEREKTREVSV